MARYRWLFEAHKYKSDPAHGGIPGGNIPPVTGVKSGRACDSLVILLSPLLKFFRHPEWFSFG